MAIESLCAGNLRLDLQIVCHDAYAHQPNPWRELVYPE